MNNTGFLFKGLLTTGGLCFVWYSYLMFFTELNNDSIILLLMACVGALLFPLCMIYKSGISLDELKKGVVVVVCSLLINIIVIIFVGNKGSDFIDKIIIVLSSEPYRWLYLFMLVVTSVCVIAKNKLSIWLTSVLLGILAPAIIAFVLYLILLVIAVIIVFLFGGSKGSSSLSSNTIPSGKSDKNDQSSTNRPNNTSYYTFFIAWSDGVHAPYTCTEKYPKDVSATRVASDLKKKFGSTAELIDFHIWDPAHDSALNYR